MSDGDAPFGSKEVRRAFANVNGEGADAVSGLDATDQRSPDQSLIQPGGNRRQVSFGQMRSVERQAPLRVALSPARRTRARWRRTSDPAMPASRDCLATISVAAP